MIADHPLSSSGGQARVGHHIAESSQSELQCVRSRVKRNMLEVTSREMKTGVTQGGTPMMALSFDWLMAGSLK